MENLTTFQLAIFYTLTGIVAILAFLAFFILRSSVRYYIMFSSKIILRNIEFVDGEMVLIGDQKDEERVKELISVQKFPKRVVEEKVQHVAELRPLDLEEDENRAFFNREASDDIMDLDFVVNNDPDDDYYNIVDDLDVDSDFEKDLTDAKQTRSIEDQKTQLVEINIKSQSAALERIDFHANAISNSFLPSSKLYDITNAMDIALSSDLANMNLSEESILFYRNLGGRIIALKFHEFLIESKKFKEGLKQEDKKKSPVKSVD